MSLRHIPQPLKLQRGQQIEYITQRGTLKTGVVKDPTPLLLTMGLYHYEIRTPKGLKLIPHIWIEKARKA